jgi:hypothetical protein
LGREIILGNGSGSGPHTVDWDTRGLPSAPYAIRMIASDAIGNWKREEVTVSVDSPAGEDPDGDGYDNLILRAEVAGDPAGPWSSDPQTAAEILHQDSERLIVRDRVAIGAEAKRFIRLRTTLAP